MRISIFIKSLFLAMPLFVLVSCNNTELTYWENDNIKSEIPYKDGEISGVASWYYENGNKHMESRYEMGSLEGPSIRWFKNGKIQLRENYENNMLNGSSVAYNINGVKEEEKNYRNDTLHGKYIRRYPDGGKMIEGSFNMGLYDGNWMYWGLDGNMTGVGEYRNGKGVQKGWYPNGELKVKTHYLNNLKHGQEIHYNPEGKPVKRIIYEQGEPIREEMLIN